MTTARARWIDPRQLERLAGTRLRARGVVEGVLAGLHRSPHKGASVEFAEYKEYAPGDDLRHIDWRAYGRIDRYYVKQFEDETNLRAWFVLDTSGSMDFAFEDAPKKVTWASTFVAAMAWVLLSQGDAPGLLVFDERPGFTLPPSSKKTRLDDICAVLDAEKAGGGTNVEAALGRIAERVYARSLVVLVSDLLDAGDDVLTLARVLRRRGLEVVVVHVLDRAERELPYEGLTVFEGLEGEGELLADPDDLRAAYRDLMDAHVERVRSACRAGDIEVLSVTTDQPVEGVILDLLRARARGRRR